MVLYSQKSDVSKADFWQEPCPHSPHGEGADIPTGTDEGDNTIYYKVVGDGNHNDVAVHGYDYG